MSESLERGILPQDNLVEEKQGEQKESDGYLKLARDNPHTLTEEIKKNPKTEPLLRKILGDTEYERIRDLNTIKLSEDTGVANIQKEIYSFVDINPDTDRNGVKEKFIKGLIDSIIIENSELAMKIIETKGVILKDMLAQIFSWEGLKQIAEGLGKSVMGIFSGDAYKTGKSLGELGLITVGSGAGGFVLKRVGKGIIQAGERVAVNAGKKTLSSQGLQIGGRTIEGIGKVAQAPYNAVEVGVKKVGGAIKNGVRAGSETLGNIPQVQKITEPVRRIVSEGMENLSNNTRQVIVTTKERVKETLAFVAVPILVGSKDGVEVSGKLRGQLGAVGDDVSKIKLFDIVHNPIYKEFPFLEKYADVLGNLHPSDIISDIGTQALIVKPRTLRGFVAKIERPNAKDKVIGEYSNHVKAYTIWKEGRKNGGIPENIFVPKIQLPKGVDEGIVLIEQVQGQSLHTKALVENAYKIRKDTPPLTQEEMAVVSTFTDGDAKRFIMEKYNYSADEAFSVIELYSTDKLGPYLHDRMRPTLRTDLSKALEYMSKQQPGISQGDQHPGNFMVTNDGKIYIIDWGRAKMTNVPNSSNP